MADTTSSATIRFNGVTQPWLPGQTIEMLIEQHRLPEKGVATAVNGTFVARNERGQVVVQPGDDIATLHAIVGG